MTNDELRQEFEAWLKIRWAKSTNPFLRRCNEVDADRYYQDYDAEFAWIVYQACNAKRQEEMARDKELLHDCFLQIGQRKSLPACEPMFNPRFVRLFLGVVFNY
jgi:hypothetical protein